ncbi:MAG: hypothetical protein RLZZ385_22 [Pseudomonadota bacterium]|jgi:large subunit ribosomal protein L15
MRLNTLSPAPGSTQAKKRLGRGIGSGLGKTSGKGHKGQKARKSGGVSPAFEGGQMPIHMRLPKFGFTSRMAKTTAEVRTSELSKVAGDVVNLAALRKANLITANIDRVRVMLSGAVTKPVTVKGIVVTKGAKAAIEAAGGKVIEIEKPKEKRGKLAKKANRPAKQAAAE